MQWIFKAVPGMLYINGPLVSGDFKVPGARGETSWKYAFKTHTYKNHSGRVTCHWFNSVGGEIFENRPSKQVRMALRIILGKLYVSFMVPTETIFEKRPSKHLRIDLRTIMGKLHTPSWFCRSFLKNRASKHLKNGSQNYFEECTCHWPSWFRRRRKYLKNRLWNTSEWLSEPF